MLPPPPTRPSPDEPIICLQPAVPLAPFSPLSVLLTIPHRVLSATTLS